MEEHMRSARVLAAAALTAAALGTAPAHAVVSGGGLPGGAVATDTQNGLTVTGSCGYVNGTYTSSAVATNVPGALAPYLWVTCDYYPNGVSLYASTTGYSTGGSKTGPNSLPGTICVSVSAQYPNGTNLWANHCTGGGVTLDTPFGQAQVVLDHPLIAAAGDTPRHLHDCTAAQCDPGQLAGSLTAAATGHPSGSVTVTAGGQTVTETLPDPVCVGGTERVCTP
jgi:hypothetical protein